MPESSVPLARRAADSCMLPGHDKRLSKHPAPNVPPYTALLATMWSPVPHSASSVAEMAAMPEAQQYAAFWVEQRTNGAE